MLLGYSDTAKGQFESFFLLNQVLILKKRWGTEASLEKATEAAKPAAIHGTGIFANIYHKKSSIHVQGKIPYMDGSGYIMFGKNDPFVG